MTLVDSLTPLSKPANLQHYLATHLTGAAGATSMLHGLAERLDADDLRGVVAELAEEQRVLRTVAEALDMSPSAVTRAGAVATELASRAGRWALGVHDLDLRDLGELEAVVTGINGKKAMWRLLPALVDAHPPLGGLDYRALLADADRQEAIVEAHRVAHGLVALSREATR